VIRECHIGQFVEGVHGVEAFEHPGQLANRIKIRIEIRIKIQIYIKIEI
jgi:hypothetical protein